MPLSFSNLILSFFLSEGVVLSNNENTLSNDTGYKENPLSVLVQSGLVSIVSTDQPGKKYFNYSFNYIQLIVKYL